MLHVLSCRPNNSFLWWSGISIGQVSRESMGYLGEAAQCIRNIGMTPLRLKAWQGRAWEVRLKEEIK